MDCEPEELQFLGLLGILVKPSKLIASVRHHRLFSQITASLILPLSLLFLTHVHISYLIFSRIDADTAALDRAPPDSPSESRLLSLLSSEWALFILYKAIYLLFLLVFALLSTSAVIYTVASIFTAKDLTFKQVFTVVPKVWKRLMVTFLWAFLVLVAYHVASAFVIVGFILLLCSSTIGIVVVSVLILLYLAGLIWISVVWHIAIVISILKDHCSVISVFISKLVLLYCAFAAMVSSERETVLATKWEGELGGSGGGWSSGCVCDGAGDF